MMRKAWGGVCVLFLWMGLSAQSGMGAPESPSRPVQPVRLLGVKAIRQPTGTALQLLVSGPFSYTSYQAHKRNLIVDLRGVVAEPAPADSAAKAAWVAEYHFLPFRNASGQPVLRIDFAFTQECTVDLYQPDRTTLLISCPTVSKASASVPPPSGEPPPASPDEPVRVRSIVVREQERGLVLEVLATGSLGYKTLILKNPIRLVVDLPRSVLIGSKRRVAIDSQAVVGVRVAQFKAEPPITRLVVDLLQMVPFEVTPTAEGLRLILRYPAGKPTASREPARPVATASSASGLPEPVKEVEQQGENTGTESSPVLVASLAPLVPAQVAVPSLPLASVETASAVGAGLAPTVAPAPAAPAQEETPAAPQEETPAAPQQEAPPVPQQETPPPTQAETPSAPFPALQEPFGTPRQIRRRYTGEPISVNLKEVDLKDFFRLIHEISGLNIVVDPNVSGTVTIVLIDVPWDQALDIVLRNNGLGSTLEGNVLRIATRATLKKEQEEQRDLIKARAEAVDPVTIPRQLSYARAADVEPIIERFLSSRGEVIRDDRTNTIIVRDIPTVIPEIDSVIQQLDRKSQQVEIEARVVSASRAFSREIGTQFATSFSTTGGRSVFGGALEESPFLSVFPPPLIAGGAAAGAGALVAQPLATDLRATDPTSGFLFGHRSPNFALDLILTAAESRNIAKVLSKPRLVTQNNIVGEVKQGTRIPVQTVVNNTISTQFIDVVLLLRVKPQITAEGTVFLDIEIENASIDPGIARINGIPALATQEITTQVLVTDGGTVVIGGVMVTNNATTVDQVPLIGSIPVIGHLFKRTRVETVTQELLFFIMPRVLQT